MTLEVAQQMRVVFWVLDLARDLGRKVFLQKRFGLVVVQRLVLVQLFEL